MPQDWEESHLQPRQMAGMISHLWGFFFNKDDINLAQHPGYEFEQIAWGADVN